MGFKFTPGKCCLTDNCERSVDKFNRAGPAVGNGWVDVTTVSQTGEWNLISDAVETEDDYALMSNQVGNPGDSAPTYSADGAFKVDVKSDNEGSIYKFGWQSGYVDVLPELKRLKFSTGNTATFGNGKNARIGIPIPGLDTRYLYLEVKFGSGGYVRLVGQLSYNFRTTMPSIVLHKSINIPINTFHEFAVQVCTNDYRPYPLTGDSRKHAAHIKILYDGTMVAEAKAHVSTSSIVSNWHFAEVEANNGKIIMDNLTFYLNLDDYPKPDCGVIECDDPSCLAHYENYHLPNGVISQPTDDAGPYDIDQWEVNNGEAVTTLTDRPIAFTGIFSLSGLGVPAFKMYAYDLEFQVSNSGGAIQFGPMVFQVGTGSKAICYGLGNFFTTTAITSQTKTIAMAAATWIKLSVRGGLFYINDVYICTEDLRHGLTAIRTYGVTQAKIRKLKVYIPHKDSIQYGQSYYEDLEGNLIECPGIPQCFWFPVEIPTTVTLVLRNNNYTDFNQTYILARVGTTCSYELEGVVIDGATYDIGVSPDTGGFFHGGFTVGFVRTLPSPTVLYWSADFQSTNSIQQNAFFENRVYLTYSLENHPSPGATAVDGSDWGYIEY